MKPRAGFGPPRSSRTPSHLPPGNNTGLGEKVTLICTSPQWGHFYDVPSDGMGLVSGRFLDVAV